MKETDYIVIQAPMVTQLKLSGNSLLIFALIHGFSKDGEHSFTGSLDYICKWTNISKTSVISNLKQLVEKGFISKQERIENGVKFCSYRTNYGDLTPCKESSMVVKKLKQGSQETLMGGSQESLPNNNSKDKNRDNIVVSAKAPRKTFTPPTIDEVRDYCLERNNGVDAQRFVDYYTSNGWMVGRNKMKDWKASVRTWERTSHTPQNGYRQEKPKEDKMDRMYALGKKMFGFDINEYTKGILPDDNDKTMEDTIDEQ